MNPTPGIHVDTEGDIAVVTMVNPAVHNALTRTMWRDLTDTVRRLDDDPSIDAIVLRGSAGHFSAGADIGDLPDDPDEFDVLHLAAENALATATTPTIASISGTCVGGGCELAVACDVRFADDTARFGITASRLGIVYPAAPTWRLVDAVGSAVAKRILIGGEIFDATWALRVGLVSELCDAAGGGVDRRALDFAQLLSGRSRESVGGTLRLFAGQHSRTGADYREGVAAFRERRSPRFARPEVAS